MKQNSRLGHMLMMFMAILKIRDDRNKSISAVTANLENIAFLRWDYPHQVQRVGTGLSAIKHP